MSKARGVWFVLCRGTLVISAVLLRQPDHRKPERIVVSRGWSIKQDAFANDCIHQQFSGTRECPIDVHGRKAIEQTQQV